MSPAAKWGRLQPAAGVSPPSSGRCDTSERRAEVGRRQKLVALMACRLEFGKPAICLAVAFTLLLPAALRAQTPSFLPLQVSPSGIVVDSSGKPVLLRGLNRSGTGSGNADATATDQDYAAQNKLLSMNLVRIFVNANWWNNNVQVPIANQAYQTYIDTLIQRAKKYGNYVLVLKAGQFPDPPCGASGQSCPAPNQGDLNCQANASLCSAQDTTGNNIDAAFSFWANFAAKYAADPAVLYDTWEDMHGISASLWSDDQNQLIAAIRTTAPLSLIFVEDTGTAFESIAAGTLPDLAWSNIVWNFHLYNASTSTCTEPASPRYANWSKNLDPLVNFAQQNGHGVAFAEWGGCNDNDPYNTNITSYAKTHSISLAYFDSTNLLTSSDTLTATGSTVAAAYTAIAAISSAGPPVVAGLSNAESGALIIAPNTWVQIYGTGLTRAGDARAWQGSDFFGGMMPQQLDGVSVTVNGNSAFVYYISPGQVNILTPPDAMLGPVQVVVTNNGVASASVSSTAQAISPAFFINFGSPYVLAQHSTDYSPVGPTTLYPGSSTPAKPNETVVLYANGFGPISPAVVSGSSAQSGTLTPLPTVTIGGLPANVTYAGINGFPGLFQFNVVVPPTAPAGDLAISATFNGIATQSGLLITVQH